jgi:UDP-N-acetylmuramate dehydrogenase
MEWAVGIPGSVGGAVRMNAGGHGAETRDRLVGCRLVDLAAGTDRWVPAESLELGYRHSAVRPSQLVVAARYHLDVGDAGVSAARIAEIVRWRRENQPGGQNAGSVFTNPPSDSAGRLIDAAGLKELRIGTASVSEKHANFIQADPGGSADDVRRLVEVVQRAVAERTGVELAVELRMVGWDPALERADPPCS